MEKSYFEQMGGTYREEGGYLIPNLSLPEREEQSIGVWGQKHLQFLKRHRRGTYTTLLTSCKLNAHLASINCQAEEMFSRLVQKFSEKGGVTEILKAENQIEWARKMNSIRDRATEVIDNDLIYR